MTLQQKVGQLFAIGLTEPGITEEFRSMVQKYKVGNVILFAHNIVSKEQVTALNREIRDLIYEETGQEPLILVDEEGGVVSRLPEQMAALPSALAQASVGDEDLIREGSRMIGEELLELGINVNLAPVLEINNNPARRLAGARSFGEDAESVSRYALAALSGYQASGILCCAKHFPGAGEAVSDTHISLPVLEKSGEEMEELELVPFRALIEAGVPAVMISHLVVPSLAGERVPCTMSRAVVTDYLRKKLRYDGLVISDCMEMEAVHTYFGTERGCVAAVNAGISLVISSHSARLAERGICAVMKAVEDGTIPESVIDDSLSFVLRAKEKLAAAPKEKEWADESRRTAFADSYLKRTIRPDPASETQRFQPGPAPFFASPLPRRTSNVQDEKNADWDFAHEMRRIYGGRAFTFSAEPTDEEIAEVLKEAKTASGIVLGTLNAHINRGQLRLAEEIGKLGIPAAHVALTNPYDLDETNGFAFKIALYEYSRRTVRIVKEYFSEES